MMMRTLTAEQQAWLTSFEAERELPALKGSEKQVAWARDIRSKLIAWAEAEIAEETARLEKLTNLTAQQESKRRKLLAAGAKGAAAFAAGTKKIDTAKFWIDAEMYNQTSGDLKARQKLVWQIAKM